MQPKSNLPNKEQEKASEKSFWFTLPGIIALIIIAIIGYYLITEHGAHIAGFFAGFPWLLLLLLCPLMHFFMHGKHSGHSGGNDANKHHHEGRKDPSGKED